MADRYQYHPDAMGGRDSHGAARSQESDPLAELARLIGQTDPNAFGHPPRAPSAQPAQPRYPDLHQQQDFEPAEAEPAPPSWMRSAATTGWPPQPAPTMLPAAPAQHYDQADQHGEQHYQHEQDYSDTPAFLRTARQHDPSRYDDVLYDQNAQNAPQYADAQYQDQHDPDYQPYYADGAPEEPQRKRGGLMTVAAVLVLAVVGTAAAYGYRSYTGAPRGSEPPVIKAEPGTNKIVPPTQTTDASGKIVDRIGGSAGGPERVLSREEQPIDINSRNPPRVVFPPLNQNASPPALAATSQSPPAQQLAANGALSDEPKRVRTMTIRPDRPDAVPSGTAVPRPTTSARAQAPAPSGNGPISLSPGASPTRTAAVSPPPAAVSSGGSGGYMVQISSQRSEPDAQAAYRAVQSKFPNVLGARSASIRRVELGEKGVYYRALVGPFAAAEEAAQLCNSLKSAGGQCVVQKN